MSCQQSLTLSFFFDGTGNNLDADVGTWEHSNVARLYRSHREDNDAKGLYRFYLPGIGTYFMDREVQDPGGTMFGRGFGAMGQARLNWAFARLREKVEDAEKRALNPTNKICWIKVSAFGFSRGAAQARAFARDLQKLCEPDAKSATGWRLRKGGYPIEITFLGLWDTVASAGLPPSANNLQRNRYAKALEGSAGAVRRAFQTPELKQLAFGEAGADPAPGPADGHADWATGMAIGDLVKRCAHMVAGHELRNSFASDSVLYAASPHQFALPLNTNEWVYPGVHSDVGGGYRPGEGGCRPEKGAQLSLVALRSMHELALKAGVPLVPLSGLVGVERDDFALDGPVAEQYAKTLDLWQRYLKHHNTYSVPGARSGLGGEMVKHMRAYYAWRFRAIRIARESARTGHATQQQEQVMSHEATFASDRKKLDADYNAAAKDLMQAQDRQWHARVELDNAQRALIRFGTPVNPVLVQKHELAKRDTEQKQIRCDRIRARVTTAADDSKLNASIAKYDQMLYDDAVQIVGWMREDEFDEELDTLREKLGRLEMQRNSEMARLNMSGAGLDPVTLRPTAEGERMWREINGRYEPQITDTKARIAELKARRKAKKAPTTDMHLGKLRPHYRGLVDAYLDEFERGLGLKDEKVIAFFDDYVHDSLAGFDTDETWPSDPRMVYVGGDHKLRFAQVDHSDRLAQSASQGVLA